MKRYFTCLLLLSSAGAMADNLLSVDNRPTAEKLKIERDGLTVRFDEFGIKMDVDGIPFSKHSAYHVCNSTWTHSFFSYAVLRAEEKTSVTANALKTHLIGAKSDNCDASQTIEILPERTIRFTTEGECTSQTQGVFQIFPFSAEPEWFAGCNWTATLKDGSTTTGTFAKTIEKRPKVGVIFPDFKELNIDSSICPVTIRSIGEMPVAFGDWRWNTMDARMLFCCGLMALPQKFPCTYKTGVEVQFGKTLPILPCEVTADAPIKLDEAVKGKTEAERDVVIPTPKNITWGAPGKYIDLKKSPTVAVRAEPKDFADTLMNNFIEIVDKRAGVKLQATTDKPTILFVLDPDLDKTKIDYYRITMTADAVTAEAPTTSGLVSAAATLRQLLRADKQALRSATVEDWADMPLRGIHCFTGHGAEARDLQVQFLHDVMGELKINTLLYECSYINWKCRDAINHHPQHGMDPELVKDIVAAAGREFIEIVPLVNTLGHAEWLLNYKNMRHLADDPDHPYAYDCLNPEVYKICDQIYDECIELFKPRAVHIGHDEVNLQNTYPKRPESIKVGETKLVIDDINHWYKFLTERGKELWMWQDMMFNPNEVKGPANAATVEEAKERRAKLNKKIVMVDWNYEPLDAEQFTGLQIESKEGFDNIAATWYTLANITNYAAATAQNVANPAGTGKTRGMIHTTWAGYSFDRVKSYATERTQYASYIWAAEQMWNGGKTKDGGTVQQTSKNLTRLMGEETVPAGDEPGFIIPLKAPKGVLGLADLSVKNIFTGRSWADRLRIDSVTDGVVIAGRLAPTPNDNSLAETTETSGSAIKSTRVNRGITKLVCPVDDNATQLFFIGASVATAAPKTKVAEIVIAYDDGTQVTVPARLGSEMAPFTDKLDYPGLNVIDFAPPTAEKAPVLHAYCWNNPEPTKKIKSITINSAESPAGWYLRAITGVNKK